MLNLDNITNVNNKEHNKKWQFIVDQPNRILIIGGSGSEKTNALLYLISQQICHLHAKDLSKPKYECLTKKHEDVWIKHFNDPNAFIECSNIMDDVYENVDDYNPKRQRKILIVVDDMLQALWQTKHCKP